MIFPVRFPIVGVLLMCFQSLSFSQATDTVAPVEFSAKGGLFAGPVNIELSCPTPGAVIRYTLNNTVPSSLSPEYTQPFVLTNTATVRARVFLAGNTDPLPIQPARDAGSKRLFLSNEHWKTALGSLLFGLPLEDEASAAGLTFRALFPYFARRAADGGFLDPFKHSSVQQPGAVQLALTYLLGLDWTIPDRWAKLRVRERSLKELKKAAGSGVLGEVIGTAASLRTELTIAEARAARLRRDLAEFRVLDEYKALEQEASALTREISTLNDEDTADRELLQELHATVQTEVPPAPADLQRAYAELGVHLPDAVVRRFDDVQRFHESVVANRRSYLSAEIGAADRRVASRERQRAEKDTRRGQIMAVLASHGALEHFAALQAELGRAEAQAEALRQRYQSAEALETGKIELDIERNRLLERLKQDYREQGDRVRRAVLLFEEISSALYEQEGSLTIEETTNGPKFDVRIHAKKSGGIKNMQVFCLDLMLMRLCSERGIGPGFLVHDSHLFDGVDERQIANALDVGARFADECGFQYVVTMNSDVLPKRTPGGLDLDAHRVPVDLTDATDDGGLFGLRFA